MRTRSFVLLVALVACGDREPPPEVAPPELVDRTPGPAPTGMAWEARFEGGRATLAALGEGFVELDVGAIALQLGLELPELVVARLHPDAAIEALAVEGPDGATTALALPLRPGDPEALGLRSGGPRGSRWLGADEQLAYVPAHEDAPALVVVASTPEALTAALPYLAFTRAARAGEPGMRARIPRAAVPGLRGRLEGQLRDVLRSAREDLARERARHAEPPSLGEPEPLIALAEARLGVLLSYLGDVGDLELALTRDAAGLHLALRADVTEGSPLATALQHVPATPLPLAALPASTAVAFLHAGDAPWAPHALDFVGERWGARERDALSSLADALPRGTRVMALGPTFALFARATASTAHDDGTAVTAEARDDGTASPAERRDRATALTEVRDDATTLRALRAMLAPGTHADGLADGLVGPSRTLYAARRGDLALFGAERERGADLSRTLARWPNADAASLGAHPDAARAVSGLARFALYVDVARLLQLLAGGEEAPSPHPVVFRVQDGRALELTLDATPAALTQLLALGD